MNAIVVVVDVVDVVDVFYKAALVGVCTEGARRQYADGPHATRSRSQ